MLLLQRMKGLSPLAFSHEHFSYLAFKDLVKDTLVPSLLNTEIILSLIF